ncbi:hypothetical protein SopranoGao_70 [Klebsiella phage SopranoGao]|uniref:Uncharacterized protein n=1 Tax=Klebsiella phage SopranoGao TaxID=2026944 RepID=A0A248SLC5_9CAUD|nr:hypothetical protein KMC54_gp70 [Klebsiella phage SopranoGao]ASV45093.1 hypothetical protein SopranoGao_70 [Klebsiella phage SopranoGao]
MSKLKMCMVAVLGLVGSAIQCRPSIDTVSLQEPTGGYPVTDRHTGKAKERREAKRRRRAKGRK